MKAVKQMARFRGTIKGSGKTVSRLGDKKSGLDVTANSWEIGIAAELYYDEETDRDVAVVYLTGGSNRSIYREVGRFVAIEKVGDNYEVTTIIDLLNTFRVYEVK